MRIDRCLEYKAVTAWGKKHLSTLIDRGQSLKWWGRLQCRHVSRCPDMFWMVCVACLEAGYFDTFKPLGLSVHYCCCSLLVIWYSHDVSIPRIPRQQDSNIGDVASFGAGASKRYVRWKMYLQGWRKLVSEGSVWGSWEVVHWSDCRVSQVLCAPSRVKSPVVSRKGADWRVASQISISNDWILENITLILLLYS